jgi:hypothetical protein
MRKHKKLFVLLFLVIGVAAAFAFLWTKTPSSIPDVSIAVLGYTNVTRKSSNPIFPNEWIRADILLTNKGTESITYWGWGMVPAGWLKARTLHGTTNGPLETPFTMSPAVVPPRTTVNFSIALPIDTTNWQCGFSICASSMREQVGWNFVTKPSLQPLVPYAGWLFRILSGTGGPQKKFTSDEFNVASGHAAQ